MKTIILAGGMGTRLSEETSSRPKPMVEVAGWPILVHVMSIYAHYGHKDFVIACGYKSEVIKRYFNEIQILGSDFTIDLTTGEKTILQPHAFDWRVSCVFTGHDTMTGGRIKRLKDLIGNETFFVTYGDGVGNVDIEKLLKFHKSHGKLCTVTAVTPAGRFGSLKIEGGQVTEFAEKVDGQRTWINGGFFAFEPGMIDYISGDPMPLEDEPLTRLAEDGELMAFQHNGFWHPVDTLRDLNHLNALWASGKAPWRLPRWPF